MKKIVTLAMLALTTLTASAQETTYRKSWDFTKWSATTVANLKAESAKGPTTGAWSDVEKNNATEPTELSKDNCFWEVTAQGNATEGATLMANSEVIPELEGLLYTNTTARSLAIAVDYQNANATDAAFQNYHGASYLWLGSKEKNYFVIPHVAPGTTIKMGVESHKQTDARGVQLFVGFGNSGTQLNAPDGNAVAAPTTYQDQEWLVPTELTDTPNEDGTYNIQVRNTNGCHIYYITVGEGDEPAVEEAKKVAYLYSGSTDTDMDYMMLSGDPRFDFTTIDVATKPTLETLKDYQAVVVAKSVTDAAVVKPLIAFIPVVNLNPNLYEGWGYGKAVAGAAAKQMTIVDAKNAIFEGLEGAIDYEAAIPVVELANYFADDDVLAKAGENVAIHTHNPGRNAYYYIPVDGVTDVYSNLLPQTILAAAKTQRDVAAVGTPNITFTQEDGKSIVTIIAANSKAIYYTLDGTDPTTTSTLYTEPFEVTENKTVKAFATGDGFTDSEIGSKDVTIATKLAKPTITVAREAGKSTVTIAAADGAKVYFNFTGSDAVASSQEYTEPVELTEPTAITAIAEAEGFLTSDKATEFVGVNGIDKNNLRWDILTHMDANADDWSTIGSEESRSSKVNYIFGKKAQSMYTDEIESTETLKDSQGNDSIVNHYKMVEPTVVLNVTGDWKVTSRGQVLTWENPAPGTNVGAAGSNCPEFAIDHMPVNGVDGVTKNMLNFKGKVSGEPYNATIQTAKKYRGPFDIVVYFNNGSAGSYPKVNVEISTDEQNWTKVDTLATKDVRLMKRNKLSYEGSDEVYVRLAHVGGNSAGQVFDIYLMNNGEESAKYDEKALEEQFSGISETRLQPVKNVGVYNLRGVRMRGMQRGLNIVVGADGSARKVVVK